MHIDLDSLLAVLRAALPVAKQLAAYTTSQWDDRAVAVIEAIIQSPALADFLRLILGDEKVVNSAGEARTAAIQECVGAHCNATVQAEAEAKGIPWATLIQYLPLVIRLVLTFMGRRG